LPLYKQARTLDLATKFLASFPEELHLQVKRPFRLVKQLIREIEAKHLENILVRKSLQQE